MYPWRRILVPTDFSTAAEWVFDAAGRIAGSTNAELLILHVRRTSSSDPTELRFPADPSLYEYAEQQELELLRTRMDQVHANVKTRLVVKQAPDPGKEICRAATAEDVDLVVIATHARHHVAHLLIGSTTLDVLRTPPTPALAIRYGIRKREEMRKLVVPIHLKQTSNAAVDLASKIAGHQSGEVHLVTICSDEEREAAERLLGDVASRHGQGREVKRAMIRGSDVEREILRYTREINADAVFLNSDSTLGNAKVNIIRNAPTPVMIVPTLAA
jgi:nucleotide-binding universal stress UspA family protein